MERRSLELATTATRFLHEMSELLFKIRKEHAVDQPEDAVATVEVEDSPLFQPHPFQSPEIFPGLKWDRRWLDLVLHYSSLLKWSPANPVDTGISRVEVLLDLFQCLFRFIRH